MKDSLQTLMAEAKAQGDMNSAFRVANSLRSFFECGTQVATFLKTSKKEDAQAARDSLQFVAKQIELIEKDQAELEKLDATLKDEKKTARLTSLHLATTAYGAGIEGIMQSKGKRDELITDGINRIAPEFTATIAQLEANPWSLIRKKSRSPFGSASAKTKSLSSALPSRESYLAWSPLGWSHAVSPDRSAISLFIWLLDRKKPRLPPRRLPKRP